MGGLVPPLVTPLKPDRSLDVPALERVLEHVLKAGVHGVFMLGTTGEAYVLTEELRHEVVEVTARYLKGRMPLYVGVGDAEPGRVQDHAEAAAEAGADFLVLISPAYFDYAPGELSTYFATLAEGMPRPVVLYNNPGVTRNPITPEVLQPLFTAKNIVGIKDSTGAADLSNRGIVQLGKHPHFRWFEGIDTMIAQAVTMGAHGGVAGGANLFPRVYVRLFEAAKAGNLPEARKMQQAVVALQAVYREDLGPSTGVGSYLKGVKYGLHVLGLAGDDMSWPFQPLSKQARTGIERIIKQVAELAGE
jgi:4-hydroxy-tetrahydrodipicolinate synthase